MFIAASVIRVAVKALFWLNGDWIPFLVPNFAAVLTRRLDILCAAAFVVHIFVPASCAVGLRARVFSLWHERFSFLSEVPFDPCYIGSLFLRQGL